MRIALLLLFGCSDHELVRLDREDYFLQAGTDQADILFVIDDSQSMADEQALVAHGFRSFIDAMGETEVDFHLGVITTDMDVSNPGRGKLVGEPAIITQYDDYEALFKDRVEVGIDGSDKERGLLAAVYALSAGGASDHNQGFLREDAVLAVVFVSDEEDCSDDNFIPDSEPGSLCYNSDVLTPTIDLVKQLRHVKGEGDRVVASAIVGPDASEACDGVWPGKRYTATAAATAGEIGDICEDDYGPVMDAIGSRISAPSTLFALSYTPVEETLEVEIDGEIVAGDVLTSWWYDPSAVAIRFDGSFVPAFGSELYIRYDIGGSAP